MKVQQFDPVIYPFYLWIIDESDVEGVRDMFMHTDGTPVTLVPSEGAIAYTMKGVVVRDDDYGFLVVLDKKDRITAGSMAHEATHVARCIWDHLLEFSTGGEADAYLVQWIVDCIEKVRDNDKQETNNSIS